MGSTRKSAEVSPGKPVAPPASRLEAASAADLPTAGKPRHRAIYEQLLSEIKSGVYKSGERLPSEAMLCERFQASRITVAKAFQSLQRDHLVRRRPGSGTFVQAPAQETSFQFGVLIPDFGTTDIFEPICQGIMRSPAARAHSLTWGSSAGAGPDTFHAAEELCRKYIAQRVSGVFFAPTEYSQERDQSNRLLVNMLVQAGIPIVLLDRDYETYPDRSNFDLVGIDNHRAGFVLTRHLLQAGARRVAFALRRDSASTVEGRAAGYREALHALRSEGEPVLIFTDTLDAEELALTIERHRIDGIVCANDVTAARLMQMMISLGIRIPADIRLAGVDDVNYAKFLATPLTTLRQDCAEIGAVAMSTMLERLANPGQPVRDVLVRCELVVRASSAAAQTS